MSITITLKFSDTNNGKGTLKVENENIIKNIFPNFNIEDGITTAQYRQLNEIAAFAGKTNVLEAADISNGKNLLKSDIAKGNASITTGLLDVIQGGTWGGNIYLTIPKGTPMKEIKSMYNLPDGSLRNYCKVAGAPGGNFDRFKTTTNQVWFTIEDFAKGNNMTVDEVKALFKK